MSHLAYPPGVRNAGVKGPGRSALQRYAHLAPDAHGKVIESWTRRRDARVTHDVKDGRPS
jgi:hypothetical protein